MSKRTDLLALLAGAWLSLSTCMAASCAGAPAPEAVASPGSKQVKDSKKVKDSRLLTSVKTTSQPVSDDLDFQPYMFDLQRRIRRAWAPPKSRAQRTVIVQFKIHANGEMSDLKLKVSSKVGGIDHAALAAVQAAAPFRPLPDGAANPVDIEFSFNVNPTFDVKSGLPPATLGR